MPRKTDASETVKPIHDRMPVILSGRDNYDLWLNMKPNSGDALERLWQPYDGLPQLTCSQ